MILKVLVAFLLVLPVFVKAQNADTISYPEVKRIIDFLASDELKGRGNYTKELHTAADFIAAEFSKDSLLPFPGLNSYFQPFTTKKDVVPEADSNGVYDPSNTLLNVVGVIPGRSLAHEAIIFSAHYDHVGMESGHGDNIFNGANDDASGVTALLALAHYYSKRKDNERTLIFCAFAGEELGLFGSKYFVEKIKPEDIVAVINIEMIGMHNVSGKNGFFLTGAQYSDLDKIIKENLKGTRTRLVNEANLDKRLFWRSDNYPFAAKGIPAHTIMCSDDDDPCYHSPCDAANRINIDNMTKVIKAIPVAIRSVVNGSQTPKRIKKSRV